MESFYVEFSHRAEKEYSKLDAKLKEKVTEAISALRQYPAPAKEFDVEKLSGSDTEYRIRIQTHRIKYLVDWPNKKVTIFGIERKKDRTYK
ncbi:MAG: type II toxin-antitoxin system RelE/ParE family toxin [archaeon]